MAQWQYPSRWNSSLSPTFARLRNAATSTLYNQTLKWHRKFTNVADPAAHWFWSAGSVSRRATIMQCFGPALVSVRIRIQGAKPLYRTGSWSDFKVMESWNFTRKIYLKELIGQKTYLRRYKAFLKGRKAGLFVIFGQFPMLLDPDPEPGQPNQGGFQCCGSGSGIGCFLTPGSGIRDPE